ncbi:ovarian cancer G-protein coupled receptor 1-like [Thunnus albacares]|uniref:ovarian cancer G-protein coupled receptor 1-like n=1 Tax=Thunnus albacares TaxID=8236 RepID=UPI001CF61BD5|nr:ovarian cancer G-protein coupled receptor 1-like [Thunnus albacares]
MEDFYNSNSDVTSNYNYNIEPNIERVITCIIISIGLPLTLVAIYSLYSQVQNNNVAPIFIINLLISDIFQFCYMIHKVAKSVDFKIYVVFLIINFFGVMVSVGFMVCIALERYLVIAWPLWYHVRRTIKSSLAVCVVVWTLPLVFVLILFFFFVSPFIIVAVSLLIPFPLLIFFLGGTLKSLSAAISVSPDEKRRIVGMLVLVLLTYTLLFLPTIIWLLVEGAIYDYTFNSLTFILLRFSPLADLILYVFMRKGAIDKLLASLCCCKMDWNVPVVHEALVSDPYEPLEHSSLKALSFKTALLLALTSAMRVSELCALSVHPSCFVVTTAGLLSDHLTDFYNYQIYSF